VPAVLLVFSEYTGLFQRLLAHARMPSFSSSVLYNVGFILFFSVLAIPYVYAFAAVYRASGSDLFWLKKFRGRAALAAACSGAAICAVYLLLRPVYGPLWETSVAVTQTYNLGADSGSVTVSSAEYLKGIVCRFDGRDSTLDGNGTSITLATARPATAPWLTLDTSMTVTPGTADTAKVVQRRLVLRPVFRPLRVTVSYRSEKPFSVASPWVSGARRGGPSDTTRNKTFTWYAFPDTPLVVPVTFTLSDSQKVRETVEVTFDSLAYPMAVGREWTYFVKRTIVDAGRTFSATEGRKQ
jgi:hypothetical protein